MIVLRKLFIYNGFFVPSLNPCKPIAPQARSAFPDKIVTIQNIVFPKLCSRIFKKLYGPETRPVALRRIKGMA